MSLNLSNTSQSLILNTYYVFKCEETDRIFVNNKINSNFSIRKMIQMLTSISKILDTKIINTSSHSFEPSGASVSSIIESKDYITGASGVMHLNESHISFHSYFEHSISNNIILRLELHISSCSNKSVYNSIDVLSSDNEYENYYAMTLDYFHRGLNLENIKQDGDDIFKAYIQGKIGQYDIIGDESGLAFQHTKIIKKKDNSDSNPLIDCLNKFLI
jgi:S-adenosylmethionine/arginine decarboxylase-like enzyme